MTLPYGMPTTVPTATAPRILVKFPDGRAETFSSYAAASDYVDWLENQGEAAEVEVLES